MHVRIFVLLCIAVRRNENLCSCRRDQIVIFCRPDIFQDTLELPSQMSMKPVSCLKNKESRLSRSQTMVRPAALYTMRVILLWMNTWYFIFLSFFTLTFRWPALSLCRLSCRSVWGRGGKFPFDSLPLSQHGAAITLNGPACKILTLTLLML